jgi:RNA polymerase sigma-70 factor, ECF subfamily
MFGASQVCVAQERIVTLIVANPVPGSADAFRSELVAIIPKLRGHALALTRSSAEADDLVQDVLLRAWRFRAGYQPRGNLLAWVNRIMRNTFYTTVAARRNTVQDVDGRHAAKATCEPDQEWRVRHAELLGALGQLTDLMREALLLVVAQGLSYEEAAEVSGCPVGTMKSRVNRGRERLAALMDAPQAPPRASARAPATYPYGPILDRGRSQWLAATNAA